MLTREEFEALSPRAKGYAVYMAGCRDDQPNVPPSYDTRHFTADELREYNAGQNAAVLECQDSEE
jgi:hypothetical protein